MKRSHVAAFRLEPGEVDLHHELVRYFADDEGVDAALNLTDRRVFVVLREPPETGWLRRALAHFSSRRIVVEIRRETFAHFEVRAGRTWGGALIAFHDLDGSVLEVTVADPALWKKRINSWLGGDMPPSPIPSAVARSK